MMGKHHMVTNTANVTGIACLGHYITHAPQMPEGMVGAVTQVGNYFTKPTGSIPRALYLLAGFGLLLLGSLLPDIDHPNSLLGRKAHWMGSHRGITHSVWPVLIFCLLTWKYRLLAWLTLGYVLHLLWDSVSAAGICWFYPFQKYREYSGGARVAEGHRVKLYHAGDMAELAIVIISVTLALLCVVLAWQV